MLNITCLPTTKVRGKLIPFKYKITWYHSVINDGPREEVSPTFTSLNSDSKQSNMLSTSINSIGNHKFTCKVSLDLSPANDSITEEKEVSITPLGKQGVTCNRLIE